MTWSMLLLTGLAVAAATDGRMALQDRAVGAWIGFNRLALFLFLWTGLNLIAFLLVSRQAYPSWAAWWREQRVSLFGLQFGLLHRHGMRSYPGAVTISLGALAATIQFNKAQ